MVGNQKSRGAGTTGCPSELWRQAQLLRNAVRRDSAKRARSLLSLATHAMLSKPAAGVAQGSQPLPAPSGRLYHYEPSLVATLLNVVLAFVPIV
jgi:hypothetical protein